MSEEFIYILYEFTRCEDSLVEITYTKPEVQKCFKSLEGCTKHIKGQSYESFEYRDILNIQNIYDGKIYKDNDTYSDNYYYFIVKQRLEK